MARQRNRTFGLLLERLQAEDFVPKDVYVKLRRLYPGHWQRSAGAWVWIAEWPGGDIGSCYPATVCLKSPELVWGNNGEIIPIAKGD